ISGRHDLVDDMESVFCVLLWLALNYSVHSLVPEELKYFLDVLFHQHSMVRGCFTGGMGKDALFANMQLNEYFPVTFSPAGLQDTI
ncbi:hypothetical protein DENSPDRAFT_747001, partial [Dentipellis sp. KUC8613]